MRSHCSCCSPRPCCCKRKEEEVGVISQFIVGTNNSPLPTLFQPATSPPTFLPLSTLNITLDEASDKVRFLASISSETNNSTVLSNPLSGTLFRFQIVEVATNRIVATYSNTDFDFATTTFTAVDQPGIGTFTYRLQAALVRAADATAEIILGVVFTAEEVEAVK
ncbi:hypothetical protein [Bacillus massiliigorillae]|uniref:hypothetical protein n=1 Tax=Bacillus massiliigorillae TaxID=1243664 RepID=UPI0003A1D73D|nr:hypothetical protein [Bacillus massiliigorillae]